MPAALPDEFNELVIANQHVGSTGFTVPWAMRVDESDECWLWGSYRIYKEPRGTAKMKIELRENGWHVWLLADEMWSPHQSIRCRFSREGMIPIEELHLPEEVREEQTS